MTRLRLLLVVALALAGAAPAPAADPPPDFNQVLTLRCTACHTRERIEQARQSGSAFPDIEAKMRAKGVRLSDREKEVLGTFWGDPLKR